MTDLYRNFAYCKLTADVDTSTTTFSVDETSRLPSNAELSAADFWMTVESTLTAGAFEIVKLTSKSTTSGAGDLTVVRGQEGTTGSAHASGVYIKSALTQGIISRISSGLAETFKQGWSSVTDYTRGDIVGTTGQLWVAVKDNLNVDPTGSNGPIGFRISSDIGDSGTLTSDVGGGPWTNIAQRFVLAADATISQGSVKFASPPGVGTVKVAIGTTGDGSADLASFTLTMSSGSPAGAYFFGWDEVALTAGTTYYFYLDGTATCLEAVASVFHSDADLFVNGSGSLTGSNFQRYFSNSGSSATVSDFLDFTLFQPQPWENLWTDWVPVGGTTGQVLSKGSDADLDVTWTTPAAAPITYGTRPTAGASHAGELLIEAASGGVADKLYVCLAGTDGTTYSWELLATGADVLHIEYLQSASGSCGYNTSASVSWTNPRTPGNLLVAIRPQQIHDFALSDPPSGWTQVASYTHAGGYDNVRVFTRIADNTSSDAFPLNNASSSLGLSAVVFEFANAEFDAATFADNFSSSTSGTLDTPVLNATSGDVLISGAGSISGTNSYVSSDSALSNVEEAIGNGQVGTSGGWEAISADGATTPRVMAWADNGGGVDMITTSILLSVKHLPDVTGTLIAHYKPASLAALNDTDSLTSWPDSSGNAHHLTPNTTAPTFVASGINGKGTVHFDGTADALVCSSFPTISQPFTVFAVVQLDATNTDNVGITVNPTGSAAPFFITTDQKLGEYALSVASSAAAFDVTTAHVLDGVFDNTTSLVAIDGTETVTSPGTNSMGGGLIVGAGSLLNASFLQGWVSELLIYSGHLSSGDRDAIRAYLGNKYAISVA